MARDPFKKGEAKPTLAVPYVPLRVFTCYTMLEGAFEPKVLPKNARKLGFPAVAIADRNGLYAAMNFSDAAFKLGIQPIIGTMLCVARPDYPVDVLDWLPLFAQTEQGYDNLCALVSMAHLDRPLHLDPHVLFSALEGRTEGLIALTGGAEGALARLFAEGQVEPAFAYADRLQALFGDRLYIELSRRGEPIEEAAEEALINLAYDRHLPLVATNPARFAEPDFHEANEAALCIAASSQLAAVDRPRGNPEGWLKPAMDMQDLFSDLPEAIHNTLIVAQRCAVAAPKRKPILPSLAGDREAEAEQLRRDAEFGLVGRLQKFELAQGDAPPADEGALEPSYAQEHARLQAKFPDYFDRLTFEVDIIIGMGFPGYFLIVADFIKWAKAHNIPVGPGRGSGAGSVVAWALTITDLDPLRLGLLFERFLNPERVSMPDFDIDFCETRRGEVIRYVQQRYGTDHVAQIITFGTMKARAVLKDVGRVLQMPYGQSDRLSKLVPNLPTDPWTLERALNGVSELHAEYKGDRDVRRLFDLAMKLEGLPRHSSTHAAGVVIGDRPLAQLVPLYRDPRSDMPVTQFDMKNVEGAGLVKFDFLGLKTLSVLQKAVELIGRRGMSVDLETLPWDDPAVFELLQRGDTVGVFQLESEGMRRTLAAVRPTTFEDIIALVSLYRPGPMDNIPTFGARKNGREDIAYPHPLLEGVLKETYGVIVYQEQVMQAAQILAGYSLGDADLLRRAMGKKIQAEMDAQRATFCEGAAKNDIAADKANELFDLIDKFAGYGFNKSHAAAYALIAYHTAWVKAHYPAEFYAASMCYDMTLTDKLAVFVDDMRRAGVLLLAPCVNHSEAEFATEVMPDGAIAVRYGLGALKSVGEKAMEQVCAERDAHGPFKSLDEFAHRIDPKALNRRQIESLAAAGAFDALHDNRAAVHGASEQVLAVASQVASERDSGQHGLFGAEEHQENAAIRLTEIDWALSERMAQEKESFGFYFSAHPVDRYRHVAESNGARSFAAVCEMNFPAEGGRLGATMAAMVEDARWRTSQRGKRYAQATLSDQSGQFAVSCFDEEVGKALEEAARSGDCLLLSVELDRKPDEDMPRVTVRKTQPLATLSSSARLLMTVRITQPSALQSLAEMLSSEEGGKGQVVLELPLSDGHGDAYVHLRRNFLIDAELAQRVEKLSGVDFARLEQNSPGALRLVS